MDASLEMKLIDCLDALERGETVTQILARYPAEANQLRPMLETPTQLAHLNLQPSLAAQAESRREFLAQAAEIRQAAYHPLARRLWQQFLPLVTLLVLVLLLGAGLVTRTAAAVPGDWFYSPKRSLEGMRLQLAPDPEARLALQEQFRRERIREIQTLLATGREAQIDFNGVIEAVDNVWIIAGLPVQIDAETQVRGRPAVGHLAHVSGYTSRGNLIASVIIIEDDDELPAPPPPSVIPTTTPAATATVTTTTEATTISTTTNTATPTMTPTPSLEPSPSQPPAATATLTPTATLEPPATATSTPPPTASPPGDGNDNNANDNDNDNDEDDSDDENENDDDDDSNDNNNDNNDDNSD